jgi:hypothetical protein
VLASVEAAELTLIDFSNLKRGVLFSVQASQTIANYWLPRHLAAFRSTYPQIEVRANIGNTAKVAKAVGQRHLLWHAVGLPVAAAAERLAGVGDDLPLVRRLARRRTL